MSTDPNTAALFVELELARTQRENALEQLVKMTKCADAWATRCAHAEARLSALETYITEMTARSEGGVN